jgi:hypothetical protein
MMRMPSKEQLPNGPHRSFVEELFVHYREAGRPTLREIAKWINEHQETLNLRGTASTETIRRILSGTVVPRTWLTVETILEALCGLADRSVEEDRWPEDQWSDRTFRDVLKQRWNEVIDHEENLPQLPPRPAPPAPTTTSGNANNDPWASLASHPGFDDEPPF